MNTRHVAYIRLNEMHLRQLIQAPPGTHIVSIFDDPVTRTIGMLIEGDALPECREGSRPQVVEVEWDIISSRDKTHGVIASFLWPIIPQEES